MCVFSCCSDYYDFVIKFEIRECNASSFVVVSQDCFGSQGTSAVSYEFLNCFFFPISVKNAIGTLKGVY